ncbi:Fic family protein [Alienimonas sp. DA493]|uniref:Fic family protein n=1 Tax=Alienimonas sp. DA493 TaxID=3373605 RepID=UPI003754C67A
MDQSEFTQNAPGELIVVRVPTGVPGNDWERDYAFVPRPLPPNWEMPLHLWPLLVEAKEKVGILEGIGWGLPNPAILLRPLRTREAVLSSRLEGTYVTPRELLLFELEGGPETPDPAETEARNDQREVSNYARALHFGMSDDRPLSTFFIRQMHGLLMEGVRGQDRHPGRFRTIQAVIGSSRRDRRFVPAPPERLEECLDAFGDYLGRSPRPIDPLVDVFVSHYQFETIHPFEDGNGRVGRLLLAVCFPRWGCLTKPWLYMSPFFESHRQEYFDALFGVSARGDWASWIGLCLRGVIEVADDTIRRCKQLMTLREQFSERVKDSGGSARLWDVAEGLFESPFVRVTNLAERLGTHYNTAKQDCEKLVEAGILAELPKTRPRTYYSPEIFDLAYAVAPAPGEPDVTEG